MKIGLVAYACSPGQGSEPGVGWNVATALAQDHEVWVFTRSNNRPAIEASEIDRFGGRLHFVYHDLGWFLRAKRLPLGVYPYHYLWQKTVGQVVRRIHRDIGFDVTHQVTFGSFRYPTSLMDIEGVPYVMGPVGGAEEAPLSSWTSFGARGVMLEILRWISNRLALVDPMLRASYRKASSVLCTSPQTAKFLERSFRLAGRTELLPSIAVESVSHRDWTGPDRGKLRALFVGRLVHWKGATLAVDAVASARRLGADVSLTILGRGPDRKRLTRKVERSQLNDVVKHVEHVPSAEAVRQLYRDHDVLLFPSLHEAGGMAVVEAMAEGLPVVCVGIGGPALSVARGGGVAVRPGRSSRMAGEMGGALARLAEDPDALERMSKKARESVAAGYTWGAKQEALTALYRRVTRSVM
jgi:glycosyltransferase involved in cell wall biosynthesis